MLFKLIYYYIYSYTYHFKKAIFILLFIFIILYSLLEIFMPSIVYADFGKLIYSVRVTPEDLKKYDICMAHLLSEDLRLVIKELGLTNWEARYIFRLVSRDPTYLMARDPTVDSALQNTLLSLKRALTTERYEFIKEHHIKTIDINPDYDMQDKAIIYSLDI